MTKADFAERLRTSREAAGLSQDEAARRIDANVRTWNRWEAEDDPVLPQINNLGRLARLFDVDASYFGAPGPGEDRWHRIENELAANRALLLEIRAMLRADDTEATR